MAAAWGIAVGSQGSDEPPAITANEAIRRLRDGNTRYVLGKSIHPDSGAARRRATSEHGQHPFATVLGCSDSRVPVELLFDQGIGDLFVVRVAGNVCNLDEAGSIEYGTDHLGTPLLVVLGHTQCGAVTAVATGAELHGNIAPLAGSIRPAVAKAQETHPELRGADLIPAAIEANVWQAIEDLLRRSPLVSSRVREEKLKIVGAIYDLESGRVKWLGEHPRQKSLLGDRSAPSQEGSPKKPVQPGKHPAAPQHGES
jgi:carbonic anhydrase